MAHWRHHGGRVAHLTSLPVLEQLVLTPPAVIMQPSAMDPPVTTQPAGPAGQQAPAARDPLPHNHHPPRRYRTSSPSAAAAAASAAEQSEPEQLELFNIAGFSDEEEEEDMQEERLIPRARCRELTFPTPANVLRLHIRPRTHSS
ncbi:hypothetical protein BDN67DRAFT_1014562 [Paxillus ammoniavirescens]|nr:hypothetical protein BDN67DRAFT_1014562 [Paxillus ammoniavirescens]